MNIKAIVLFLGATMVAGSAFAAEDQGHGKVTFKGAIIDAPCSISPDSLDQTVNLGQISNVALIDGGKSTPRTFDINLENCNLSGKNDVTLTFSGPTSDSNKTLGIVGTGSGAGVQITHGSSGEAINFNEATPLQTLQDGNNTLHFSAYLIGNGGGIDTINVGDFSAVTNFTLTYQ